MTTRIHGRCEIKYRRPTTDTECLVEISLQSGVLGQVTVSHRDWLQGATFGNGSQWLLAGNQKRQIRKVLKITQRGMVERIKSYGSIWQSVFVSFRLPVSLTHSRASVLSESDIQ